MGRLILAAALVPFLSASPLSASPPAVSATAERQRCLDLVAPVIEDLSENQSLILARLRDRLAEAAALCREGRTQEAETLLRELQGQWMPMGPGN